MSIDYDPHDWDSHLYDIRGSMVREIIGRVMTCVVWSALVTAFHFFVHPIGTPSTVHTLLGTALGLLLVFRTNSSYDRFWEGRKLWGSITNECRNLARGAWTYLSADPERARAVINWTAMFPYAALSVLRGHVELGPPATRVPPEQLEEVKRSNHLALAVTTRISAELIAARDQGTISDIQLAALDQNAQLLIDYIGGCERIRRTPMPYPYMVHLRRALIMYCFTLPFALVKEFGWGTVLDTFLVAYIFFGIEEIGVEIEDPFGDDANDLPMERFAAGIDEVLQGGPARPQVERDGAPASARPGVRGRG
jgi:putative membrane protein